MKYAYIYPGLDLKNDFIKSQQEALKYCNIYVKNDLRGILKIDLFILNWYENVYNRSYIYFFKRILFLMILKLLNKKIIYFIHNRRPHNKYNSTPNYYLSNKLMKITIILSNKVVILSKNTINYMDNNIKKILIKDKFKIVYIPHPNFGFLRKNVSSISKGKNLKILSFGPMEKYKNIELLIEVMNSLYAYPIELMIVGKCNEYMQKCFIKSRKNINIKFDFSYYENEFIAPLFARYDICAYPFDISSCLNSSSILLAFSMGKTVICPECSGIKDFPSDIYYSYNYKNEEEHKKRLSISILNVLNQKKNDSQIFDIKGDQCLNAVNKSNSQDVINQKYFSMFKSLRII